MQLTTTQYNDATFFSSDDLPEDVSSSHFVDCVFEYIAFDWSFSHCRFDECSFQDCSFQDDFYSSQINQGRFSQCNFSSGCLSGVTVNECLFVTCNLLGVHFDYNLSGSTFDDCDMRSTVFRSLTVESTIFSHCNLKSAFFGSIEGCQFLICKLANADFKRTSIVGVKFTECDFGDGMSFDKASMSNIVFNGCVMPGTTFGYTKMSKVTFNCCDASNTIFTGSQKSSLKFYGSNTSEALFGALENALIVFAIDEDATELVEAQQMQFDNCTGLYLRCTGLNMQLNTFEDVSGDFTFENCNLSGLAMATSSGSVTLSECLEVGIELDQETVENLAIHRPAQLLQKK